MFIKLKKKLVNCIKLVILSIFLICVYMNLNDEQAELLRKTAIKQKLLKLHLQQWLVSNYNYKDNYLNLIQNLTLNQLLKQVIDLRNQIQFVQNLNQSKSDINNVLNSDSIVIVVQVHDRINYLNYLIESLSNSTGIDQAFLIFSHDYYDVDINRLIEKIKFCKVLQIFYPFSLQIYANEFPGTSKNDCPRDISRKKAIEIGCLNAEYADYFGHYREASYVQVKHHWFWKINQVFDKLNSTRNHNGYFLFLEEDHYVMPDILYILKNLIKLRHLFRNVDLFTLGSYLRINNVDFYDKKIVLRKWISSTDNMGIALNRTLWKKLKECAQVFCTYDDYNWDWSLYHVSLKCLSKPLLTTSLVLSRVFHIGQCGVHHKGKCTENAYLEHTQKFISTSKHRLFPNKLDLSIIESKKKFEKAANGGWSDLRDHQLCLRFVNF